ncbi:MAG: tetratricopeptide repeat-containing protein [Burkholderiales bacterium]
MSSFTYDAKRLKRLKPACALIETDKSLGTGFLISESRLMTCDHVMKDANTARCRFGDDRSKVLDFHVVARYPLLDSAVLEASDPNVVVGGTAPTVAPTERSLDDWWGWGFPAILDGQGVPVWGQVADEDSVGPDDRHTIQLFAENLVGSSAQLGGLSGSPVLIRDDVVGMIYRVLAGASDGNQARLGMIYAIPIGPAHPALCGTVAPPVPQSPTLMPFEPTEAEWVQLRLFETLKNASSAGSILKVLEQWNATAGVSMPDNVPHLAAERLIGMGATDAALQLLGNNPTQPRAVELSALAHSLLGQHDKAHGLIASLTRTPESGGITGGIYKRKYFETGNRAWLQGAFDEYERTNQALPDPYPAINVAATALWLDKPEISRARAMEARRLLEAKPQKERANWDWATLGEAAMLAGDIQSALGFYEKAVALKPSHGRDIAVMRRQARRNLDALKAPRDRFEIALAVGGVACFTGHRVDEPGRQPPRFPRARVAIVASHIRRALEQANVRFGFSSAAGGADILFIEQLLARGGEPTIFLPFPAEDFVSTSVGVEWKDRFDAVLAHPEVTVHVLHAAKPPEPALENAAYARCNIRIQAAAVEAGRVYDETPVLIAVLRQGEEEAKTGGTVEAVRRWEELLYGKLVLIDPVKL